MSIEINHTAYIAKTKKMDEESLKYTIQDCKEALAAMPSNPKAGYYQDEIHYCLMELRRRKQSK